ncbi:YfhO family protein [Butyrivibrio sp. VCD2006]|uniref:YfhO family protein n=1 Tax=Butyrivibrio sp. VCD2006 TaxID=1280664 RepID=UPI000412E409|nr:YfhO family protein [Butyrivibrio sp. VCD2006]
MDIVKHNNDTNDSKKSGLNTLLFYLIYTAIFAAMSVLVYGYFYRNGKSLICEGDTWRQHLKAAAYYSKWLRGVLYHVFKEHSLNLQTFAFGIGYGSDLYTTLQYYALGDLLNIFSAFVKTEYIHIYFQVVMLMRAYLAGITFSLYAKYSRKNMSAGALLTGMFTYSFGSYFMYLGLWHPFFANPLIYLPLVLLGAEKILKENKPRFFAVAVFLAGTNNFYFFYIIVLLTIIYVLARLLFIYFGKHQAGTAFKTIGTFFAYGIIGSLMSMFILLPILIAFPNNPRANSGIAIPLFYGEDYYKELLKNVYSFVYHGANDTQLGFTPVFVAAAICVIVRSICYAFSLIKFKNDVRSLKEEAEETKDPRSVYQELTFLILLTLFLCLPFAGYVFGGFNYAVNRWAFSCALFAGFVTAEFADIIAGYAAKIVTKKGQGNQAFIASILSIVVLTTTLLFIAKNGRLAYSPEEGNMVKDYMDICSPEEMYAQLQSTEVQVVEENAAADGLDPANSFYRYSGRDLVWNAAMLDGISSTQFFWSLADKSVSEYFKLMAINDQQNFAYLALDDRAVLNSIAGVKYYSLRYNTPDQQAFVPCGYVPSYEKFNFGIYENPDAMPLGFTYNAAISESAFNELSPIEREEALLYGAVVRDDVAGKYPEAEPVFTSESIPYEITLEGEIKEAKGGYKAKAGSSILLTFNGNPGCETLLYLKNLKVKSNTDVPSITVSTELADGTGIMKRIDYKCESSWYYSGWHNFIVNLGNANEAKTYIRLTFNDKGTYKFDEMSVFCRSLTTMHAQLSALKAHTMQDVDLHKNPISFATNMITGSIDTEDSELLFLSVPYVKGWTAYVDGKKTELLAADTMFSAIEMSAGHHDIKLVYHTPGLFAGIILSLLGLILLLGSSKLSRLLNR